jgi:hypothetical protein
VAFCWSPARVGGIDGFGQSVKDVPASRPLITRIPCRFRRPRRYSNGWLRVAFCWSPARVGGIDGFGQSVEDVPVHVR